ncbi:MULTISPECIES: YopX family protein [Enterococcus]|uniref:YopX protein domain-containing protein n=1 Tax=Candidatus Enterococcus mangumiae TaxID=2230878 RepID=A0ABZ2STI2_9ENTE|nr:MULTISPECIES: YopX family protein [unclassified Enterococcus]MBO0490347.1 hypothetical protein [Enterococcus sp. DIV1094]MBO1298940.1 hypothetical protein [Enterococcus sp. DIV1271a]
MIPKFRALNIKTGFWFDEQELVFCDGKWFQDWRSFEDDFPLDMRDCVVMQSTGLKDKNRVEIFEGDIVKTLGADLEETLSTIKFAEGAFCVDHKNLGTEFEFLYFVDSPLEVVGNIYKNPDLLEVER